MDVVSWPMRISTRTTSDDPVAADSDVVSWGQEPPPGPVLKFIRRGWILAAAPGLRSTFRVGRFQLCLAIHPAKAQIVGWPVIFLPCRRAGVDVVSWPVRISTRMTSDDPVAADSDVVSWGQEPPPGPVLKFIRRGWILAAAPGLRSTFRLGRDGCTQ